jgi:hypothetical protein
VVFPLNCRKIEPDPVHRERLQHVSLIDRVANPRVTECAIVCVIDVTILGHPMEAACFPSPRSDQKA